MNTASLPHPSHRANGSVTLVGAGPGDPEMLTLKAVKAIASATVLLVDDLVNDAILEHAAKTARIIHVGKRGGCRSTPQSFIEKLMIQEAQAGETVVRLKGGDPFIFGRGGEEADHLMSLGIPVFVFNGITAGLAAISSLNTPLTHRDHAHGVCFVTGHAKPGDAGTDWATLAQTARQCKLTLVVYMGVSSAESIASGLLDGLPADTPIAIVQHASLPHQRHVVGALGEMCDLLERHRLGSPAVIVIGDVLTGLARLSVERPSERAA